MQLDDTASILAYADFFEICDGEQRRLLAFASERQHFSPGEAIYSSGEVPEGAHVLVSGTVTTQPDDKAIRPYNTATPGALLGTTALVLAKPRPVTIVAVNHVDTLLVPRSAFLKLARQFPDLAQRAAARVQKELSGYIDRIETIKGRIGS